MFAVISNTVLIGAGVMVGLLLWQIFGICVEEARNQWQMKRRKLFYHYFQSIPAQGPPLRESQAQVRLILLQLADEVHQHHRRWITDSEVAAADALTQLHEQHFCLAEKEFAKALALAQEFGLVKRCYTSYHHFLGPQLEEETRLLELNLQPLRSLN